MTANRRNLKDSKVSWLGAVPAHWAPMRLRDSVEGCLNGIWGDEACGDENDTPIIRVADFDRSRRRTFAHQTIRNVGEEQRKSRELAPGDLLIEKSGGGEQQSVGMVVEYTGPVGAVCSNFVARMRPREGVSTRYLVYVHAHLYSQGVPTLSIKQSTGIQNLDSTAYLGEQLYLPPFAEQVAIASYLDIETARVDALIDAKRSLLDSLVELKSVRITEILTGAADNLVPTGDVWIPRIPQSWTLKRLKHLGQVRSGLAKGKKHDAGTETLELPYMRVANVQDGHIDLSDVATLEVAADDVERYSLVVGDVLMNEGGDYDKLGRGAVWEGRVSPCLHQNHVFAVRLDDVAWAPWVSALTRSAYAKFYFMNNSKQSTNLASISQSNVKEWPVVLPPEDVRDQLLERLTMELKRADDLIDHVECELKTLAELRTATITDAVLGRIDVREHMTN